ncbi:hypothetical protein Ppa06_36370 [Planomonospora parontospora subsp. parontospora]|uniref:ATP/GTP-binding protein n=2 Tax=Planomonospora parontospora TaxID=58119 RepID=A0AA37BH63_9ACTN|nr:hypothetical protein [Planomonospora parontospora]GGK70258.1 hypothetical protein GCM10010126_32070 [Planomonospora parontospora]GII09839.1 hypothetical protein Ppa06_36370 [Planomonospora parontospora subsp. parontospora]
MLRHAAAITTLCCTALTVVSGSGTAVPAAEAAVRTGTTGSAGTTGSKWIIRAAGSGGAAGVAASAAPAAPAAEGAVEATGGVAELIGCGSEGGPGCAARARRWWKRLAAAGRLPAGGGGGDPRADRSEGAGRSGLRGRPGLPYTPDPRGPLDPRDGSRSPLDHPLDLLDPLDPLDPLKPLKPRPQAGGGRAAGTPVPPAAVLEAVDRLVLPEPEIGSSPGPEDLQLVRLPIWLTISRASWRPRTATGTAGGTTATVLARPARVNWDMGDGTTVVCRGPGTAYREGRDDPRRPSPTCGHTYLDSSMDAPNGEYRVTATVVWEVTWTAGGRSGPLPSLTTTASEEFRVAESQSVVTA